jgi:hypothetical protein
MPALETVHKALCYKPENRGSILDVIGFFNWPHYGPGAFNRNEYQESSWG